MHNRLTHFLGKCLATRVFPRIPFSEPCSGYLYLETSIPQDIRMCTCFEERKSSVTPSACAWEINRVSGTARDKSRSSGKVLDQFILSQ